MYLTVDEERRNADARKYGTTDGTGGKINYPRSHPKSDEGRRQALENALYAEGWRKHPPKKEKKPTPVCTSAYCIVCHPEEIMIPGSVGEALQKRTKHIS